MHDNRQRQHMLLRRYYKHWVPSLSMLTIHVRRYGPKSLCTSSRMRVTHLVNPEPLNCSCKQPTNSPICNYWACQPKMLKSQSISVLDCLNAVCMEIQCIPHTRLSMASALPNMKGSQ